MRVITRHSKLLYFLKHLPRWQFLALSGIVTLEAAIQGRWSEFLGRQEEARAWRTIGEVARRLRRGVPVRGREVLALAESAAGPHGERGPEPIALAAPATVTDPTRLAKPAASPGRSAGMRRGARRSSATLLEPRKDGTA
jgi:hypothetical protein